MKIILSALASTLALGTLCSQAIAQEADKAPALNPVEVFTCDYNKGKSRADLDKVIARWNKWSDDNNPTPYTAWVMTPVFYGPEITFDIVWLGGWPSYAAMGENQTIWQNEGRKMNAEFFKVLSCDTHSSMAVMPMQAPGEPTSSSLVRFMDCEIDDDASPEDVLTAHREFGSFMQSKGSDTAAWLFFPALGAGDIEYDYKLVLANADHRSLAKDGEIIANGGGWMKRGEVFKDIVQCDSPRLYQADLVRNAAAK